MNKLAAIGLSVLVMGTTFIASAQPSMARPWGVNRRETRQQNRIYQGDNNGSLTPRESRRLERQQSRLACQEARMRASGGGLSNRERRRLEREQNQLSRNIYNQKHDAQVR